MNNLLGTPVNSNLITEKLENALIELSSKLSNKDSSNISIAINEVYNTLNDYFTLVGSAEFIPEIISENDIPSPRIYNKNLITIHNDLVRFYGDLKKLVEAYVSSYNYSQLVSKDILEQANGLASIVVDLNILNNFDRGDTIVAGDDFNTLDFVDTSIALGSDSAELIPGGGGLTLSRDSSIDLVNTSTKIEIVPIAPVSDSSSVNTSPTPGNLERFYEGNFYNFLGLARPEGGQFNFKTLTSLKEDEASNLKDNTETILVDIGATEEARNASRALLFDKNPDTFWECEYIYRLNNNKLFNFNSNEDDSEQEVLSIDVDNLNKIAKTLDRPNTDLIIDIIVTLPEARIINFVSINPVLFSSDAFPEIVDIATASSTDGTFATVDGWETIKFPKYLTAEANEFLTDSQSNAILAPSKAAYKGQGVFNFPPRESKKIKIRIKSDFPTANIYERTYALVNSNVKVTTTVTTTTTKRSIF